MKSNKKIPTFVHIEKTGGTSLIHSLRQNFPFGHCDIIPAKKDANLIDVSDLQTAFTSYPFLRSIAGHSVRPYVDYGEGGDRLAMYSIFRNGTERYISEYRHDSIKRGFEDGFLEWMKYEERWNYQTRSLCGEQDLEKAKKAIEDKLEIVGIVDEYDEFVEAVRTLLYPTSFDNGYEHLNQAGLPKGKVKGDTVKLEAIPDNLKAKASELNELDNKLYVFVRDVVLPYQRAKLASLISTQEYKDYTRDCAIAARKARKLMNVGYRNLLYKPINGIWPFQHHRLPVNNWNVKEYRAKQGKPGIAE